MDASQTDHDRQGNEGHPARPGREDIELVHVERRASLDAPVADVWRCLSRLDELAGWLDLDLEGAGAGAGDGALRVGLATRAVEADGSVRHLLVTDVDEGRRLAWHWWRDGGELSAVEITLEPAEDATTVVRVVETLAVAGAGAGGRAAIEPVAGIEDRWGSVLPTLGARLVRKLGVA